MFTINNGLIYRTVSFEHDSTKIEVDSFRATDHQGQAKFVLSVLDSLYQLTGAEADDIVIDEICKKYNLVNPKNLND